MHVDAAIFDDDNTPLNDGAEVRRARLGAALTLFRDFTLKYQYDFVDEGRVLDASLTYEGLEPLEIEIGQFKEPFSLEEMTSSNNITFMERALPNEFAGGYNTGIAVSTHGANWSAAGGLFGDRIIKDVFGAGDEDLSVTGRFTYAPLHEENRVWYLGVSASRREVDEGGRVRFATDPESAVAEVNLVSTALYGTSNSITWVAWKRRTSKVLFRSRVNTFTARSIGKAVAAISTSPGGTPI